jgi:hypothetical protein
MGWLLDVHDAITMPKKGVRLTHSSDLFRIGHCATEFKVKIVNYGKPADRTYLRRLFRWHRRDTMKFP